MAQFKQKGNYKPPPAKMKTDSILHKNLMEPLNSIRSGSLIYILGRAGTGKSSITRNLLTNEKSQELETKGQKMGLSKCFSDMYIVSPSMKSFNDDIFEEIKEEFKFDTLGEFLDYFEEQPDYTEDMGERLAIFDDVGSEIKDKENLKRFMRIIHNRRHKHLTIILILQNFNMVPPALRSSANIIITFKPVGNEEQELIFDFTGLKKKEMYNFYKFMFQKPHDSVLIDLTLRNSDNNEFYRNIFNKVEINENPENKKYQAKYNLPNYKK